LVIDEWGTVLISQAASSDIQAYADTIIFEELVERIGGSLKLCLDIMDLETVDSEHRMTDVSPVAEIVGKGKRLWGTRARRNSFHTSDRTLSSLFVAHIEPRSIPRAQLRRDIDTVAADLAVLLRRRDGITALGSK